MEALKAGSIVNAFVNIEKVCGLAKARKEKRKKGKSRGPRRKTKVLLCDLTEGECSEPENSTEKRKKPRLSGGLRMVEVSENQVQNEMLPLEDTVKKNSLMLFTYPPLPEKGGLTVTEEDIVCLNNDGHLNDVVMDFYLKYFTRNLLSDEDKARSHVFSSFFYKRLISKQKRPTEMVMSLKEYLKLSSEERKHRRVREWTKDIDIFQKDFIIIPICEDSHWFLAIICFPGLTGCHKMPDNNSVGKYTNSGITGQKASSKTAESAEDQPDRENMGQRISMDESKLGVSNSVPAVMEENSNKGKEILQRPCILIFDSLPGSTCHGDVVQNLREYLKVEYKVKYGTDREFTKKTIVGIKPKAPEQNNLTDCGLYVLQYVESFFKDPIRDYKIPICLPDWFPEEVVNRKRKDIKDIILSMVENN